MSKIAIIDTGIGNLTSVQNAFDAIGSEAERVTNPDRLDNYGGLVLPGVGSFEVAISKLRNMGFPESIHRAVETGTPLLGICLGMQLLAETGDEFTPTEGLGLIPGRVSLMKPSSSEFRLPHIGWNDVTATEESILFRGLPDNPTFYFVHSYGYSDASAASVSAIANHGGDVVAGVEVGNVFGAQFHPEKSQAAGLGILRNFVSVC